MNNLIFIITYEFMFIDLDNNCFEVIVTMNGQSIWLKMT